MDHPEQNRQSESGRIEAPTKGVDIAALFESLPTLRLPTPDEMYESCRPWYDHVSPTFIDRWPEHLHALSFKTIMVPVDHELMRGLWDHDPMPSANKLAAVLDEHMGWNTYFVRLNSRSPKDSAYPGLPITCAGKQAVDWIMASERCLDDATRLSGARAPVFICLREAIRMVPEWEFRCFAKDGKVLGVTRYFYDQPEPDDCPAPEVVMANARKFYDEHLAADFPAIVFDLYAPGTSQERLIEINPYGQSDPCLFDGYDEIEQVGGFRWKRQPFDGAPLRDHGEEEADKQDAQQNPSDKGQDQ